MRSRFEINRSGIFGLAFLVAVGIATPVVVVGMRPSHRITAPIARTREASRATGASLTGTWDLLSVATRWPDGHVTEPWGKHPIGRLGYGADGRMWALLMDARRNQSDGRTVPPEVQASAASYYGTYAVDSIRHTVTHRVTASLRATEAGVIARQYLLRGDTLVLTADAMYEGSAVRHTLYWLRNTGT